MILDGLKGSLLRMAIDEVRPTLWSRRGNAARRDANRRKAAAPLMWFQGNLKLPINDFRWLFSSM